MIVLYILAGILGALVILLLIPVRVSFRYEQEAALKLRYLFWRFTLWPQEEDKKAKPKPGGKKKPAKKPPEKEPDIWQKLLALLKEKGVKGFLHFMREIAALLGNTLRRFLRCGHIQKLDIYFVAAADNAADAAMQYGEACGVLYPAAALLSDWGRCSKPAVMVNVDFNRQQASVSAQITGWILPLFVLTEGLRFLVKGVPYINELK